MRGDGGRAEVWDETGNATAVDWYIPNPRIVASITEDWFYLQEFGPNRILDFSIYKGQGQQPIWKGTATTDGSGFAWIDAEGRWNFEPGSYLVVKDGQNTKDLIIEGFTFDVFDLTKGRLIGTAPEPHGRRVWVGIGWENDSWSMDVATNDTGAWSADFQKPVPGDYCGWPHRSLTQMAMPVSCDQHCKVSFFGRVVVTPIQSRLIFRWKFDMDLGLQSERSLPTKMLNI